MSACASPSNRQLTYVRGSIIPIVSQMTGHNMYIGFWFNSLTDVSISHDAEAVSF